MAWNTNLVQTVFPSFFRNFILRKSHTNVTSVKNAYQSKAKPEKNPFMKNVFVGIVDEDVLSFPEVENMDGESSTLFDTKQSQPLSKCVVNGSKLFLNILKTGFCKYGFPEIYNGLPCYSTNLLKEIEMLDISPSTSFLLEIQYSFIINNLINHGSDKQKQQYLKDLITGEIIGAYALYEENAGSDPASLHSKAVFSEKCDGSLILNGEKSRISNGNNAELFIVFAQVEETNRASSSNLLSAFVIDRETPGLTITNELNFDGYDMCRLKFDNIHLSSDSVLGNIGDGYKIAVDTFESNKFILMVTILNVIRKLVSEVTHHISKTNRFPISFKECDLIQYKLGKLVTTVYAIESSIYFFAGLKDNYIIDTSLESVIVQNIVFSYGLSVVEECVSIFGIRAFDSTKYPYKTLLDELSLISQSFTSPEMFSLYISLKGLEYTGQILQNSIVKSRNPLSYPMFLLKRMLETRRHVLDSPKLDKFLYMHLHPSLKASANQLEYSICRLQYALQTLMVQQGTESVHRQVDLIRLSNIATDIFSMFAVLSRASRSYCTGIRHCDQEMIAANSWCKDSTKRIKINISDLLKEKLLFADLLYLKLVPDILQNKGYFFRNPSEKNIY